MTYFKRNRFAGIAPGVAPRLLADQFGQTAENIDFESGRLVATTEDSDTYTLENGNKRSIYYYNNNGTYRWLQWTEADVSAVAGPIPGDTRARLYWTGEGGDPYPRMGTSTSIVDENAPFSGPTISYRLGVPAPSAAPAVFLTGTADATATPDDVSYVYVFVTAIGEEGPPSAPSAVVEKTNTQNATIVMPTSAQPSGDYNFTSGAKKRIYRSNTGSTNTQFQLVDEVNYDLISFTDTLDAASLGEVLPSADWIAPPDDSVLYPDGPLQGLIPLAQGVMAGFTGKRFCLSEPFIPSAWPIQYRITTEENIVAIASTANGVAALTDGQPYFITGTEPSSMTALRIDLAQACVNKRSVVDMGDYVLYAGPDGLCAVQSGQGSIATKGLISVTQWNADFYPETILAFRHEGTYVAFWTSGSNHGGWVYDPRGNESSLSTLSISAEVRGGYMHPKDGQLYIIVGNKIKKYRGSVTKRQFTFKSKKYVTPAPASMGWVSVHANEYPVVVKVYGDGSLVAHYSLSISGPATVNYAVTVVNSGGNKYVIDGGSPASVLTLQRGGTYTFDQSDASNLNHPLRFKTAAGGASYSVGVVATGTPGQANAKVVFTVAADAPTSLLYYCTSHGEAMGNTISIIDQPPTYTQTTTVPSGIDNGVLYEPVMRMPAVVAQEWEIQVEGKDINEFCLAQGMDEIRNT